MLLVLMLAFSLVACGGEKTPPVDGTENAGGTNAPEVTKAPEATKAPVTTEPPVTEPPVLYKDPFEDTKYKAEDYYALYVQDGLLLHLNFASATPDTDPLLGGESYNNPEVSATKRFQGAASNFTPFLAYTVAETPVYGGTAEILTPWYFENWYRDGYFNEKTKGNGNIADLQTDEPAEFASEGDRNGTKIYVRHTNKYTTDYYLSDGVWSRMVGASKWGDGCFYPGINNSLYYGNGVDVSTGTGYTMNFSVKTEHGSPFKAYMGPRFNLRPNTSGIGMMLIAETGGSSLVRPESGFKAVDLPDALPGAINNYCMTVDLSDLANLNATYGFAVNGISYETQTVPCNEKLEALRQFFCDGEGISLYAIRTYNRILTADEIKQNNFADIAIVNKLDIEGFLKLDNAAKLEVYKAFDGWTSDSDAADLQALLDGAVAGK